MSEAGVQGELLSNALPGQCGTVLALDLPGSIRARIMEMGLTVGSRVEVIRFAPLGDPIELKVRGSHLSLRKAEAAGIRIATL